MLLVQYIIQDKKSTEQIECLFCTFYVLFSIIIPNIINNPTNITCNLSLTLMNILIDFLFLLNSNPYILRQFSNCRILFGIDSCSGK